MCRTKMMLRSKPLTHGDCIWTKLNKLASHLHVILYFELLRIIARSFCPGSARDTSCALAYEEYKRFVSRIYSTLIEKGYSYVVRNLHDKKIVATSLNFDYYDEPRHVIADSQVQSFLHFLEHIEGEQL